MNGINSEAPTELRVGWLSRILIYWFPLLFVFFALRHFDWPSFRVLELGQAAMSRGIAVAFVLLCEHFLFGCRVSIGATYMTYRYRGFPFPMRKVIAKGDIAHARYEAATSTDNRLWRYVEQSLKSSPGNQSQLVNLTAFSMIDVEKLLAWLPNLER